MRTSCNPVAGFDLYSIKYCSVKDFLQNCQICCPTSGKNGSWKQPPCFTPAQKLSNSSQFLFFRGPNYSATAGIDAVLKCSRFANVGNAAGYLEHHASMFFNAVENQVQEVDEQGRRVATKNVSLIKSLLVI